MSADQMGQSAADHEGTGRRKQRDDAGDELIAEVGIACIERPTNVRSN